MEHEYISDPITALATPWGQSAIAVIRISGTNSLNILSKLLRKNKKQLNLEKLESHTLYHTSIYDKDKMIDDIIIALYKKPTSYTGEDSAEIFCHGGLAVINSILKLLWLILHDSKYLRDHLSD